MVFGNAGPSFRGGLSHSGRLCGGLLLGFGLALADPIGIGLIGNEALGAGIVGAGRLALRVEDVEHRAGNPATVTPLLKCKRAAALLLSASLALALGHTLSPIHIGMGDDRCV